MAREEVAVVAVSHSSTVLHAFALTLIVGEGDLGATLTAVIGQSAAVMVEEEVAKDECKSYESP